MLNSNWNSSYKSIVRKADTRECSVSSNPLSELIVDFRSRLFRYIRLVYCNRTRHNRAKSVFRTMKDLRDATGSATAGNHHSVAGNKVAGSETAGSETAGSETAGCPATGCPATGCPATGCPATGGFATGQVVTEKEKVFSAAFAVTEKERVFSAALAVTKKEVECMKQCSSNFSCTYIFPSSTACLYKAGMKESQEAKTSDRLEELKKRIALYRRNMFDVDALEQCALALESYIISDLDSISTMYSDREWLLGVEHFRVPNNDDFFESDRLCARLAKAKGAAVLSEDFDNVVLFGTDMMVKEVFNRFFVYVSLKDTMTYLNSVSRIDAVRKCCLLGTDYNKGLKGIGPIKVGKIDHKKAKELFETCVIAQSIKPDKLYELFMLA